MRTLRRIAPVQCGARSRAWQTKMITARRELSSSADLSFNGYLLQNVYLRTTESQRAEIMALWQKEQSGLTGENAERTSHETVFLVRTRDGELAGVSTVALVRIKDAGRFYSYSMFLRPRDRVPNLMVAVCNATREFLRTFKHPVEQPLGMLNINENPRLMSPALRRVFVRQGFRYWGQTAQGEDVWFTDFREPGGVDLVSNVQSAKALEKVE